MAADNEDITEGLYGTDLWNSFDFHLVSYVKSSIQLRFVSSKTSIFARALRHAVVDLLDHIPQDPKDYVENEITIMGTEHRLFHTRHYTFGLTESELQNPQLNDNNKIEFEIKSLAPTVFHKLREDIGISNKDFRHSFSSHPLIDFTNPGKSGSLMFKTYDGLFILKTLREYEARLLMQILSGYHLRLTQYPTVLNRYVGLYSLRFPALISSMEIHIVVIVNAFTPSLQINEIFDLKGSSMKRKLEGQLSLDKLYKLKDLDFTNLYPDGILIPSNIYQSLHRVISNDVTILKKLKITDFSLIIGIKYVDMSVDSVMQLRPSTGIAALVHMHRNFSLISTNSTLNALVPTFDLNPNPKLTSVSYLKPLQMLNENVDEKLFYQDDSIADASLPIPGIINKTSKRVFIYLAIVDTLQSFDSLKSMESRINRFTNPTHHHEYSVIEPEEYAKRIVKFLFEHVFIDAGDDFPWHITHISKPIANIDNKLVERRKHFTHQRSRSVEHEKSVPASPIILRF